MNRNDGGSAFPRPWDVMDARNSPMGAGMSLRDYFAAKAMQASIGMLHGNRFWNEGGFFTDLAKNAYEMADAMIAARDAT